MDKEKRNVKPIWRADPDRASSACTHCATRSSSH